MFSCIHDRVDGSKGQNLRYENTKGRSCKNGYFRLCIKMWLSYVNICVKEHGMKTHNLITYSMI